MVDLSCVNTSRTCSPRGCSFLQVLLDMFNGSHELAHVAHRVLDSAEDAGQHVGGMVEVLCSGLEVGRVQYLRGSMPAPSRVAESR
jgi:hypothetical protein